MILALSSFFLIGVWSVLRPAGMIGWARRAHPELREDDPVIQFYVKLIGTAFIIVSIVLTAAILRST
jgi:hypothetical protein